MGFEHRNELHRLIAVVPALRGGVVGTPRGVTVHGVRPLQKRKAEQVEVKQRLWRRRRRKGRRKRETISTRFRDYEKEEEECLDAYRSYVREMRLCDNAITVAGA